VRSATITASVAIELASSPKPSQRVQCPAGPKETARPRQHHESRSSRPGWCAVVKALAIDVGTTSIRTAIVDANGTVTHAHRQRLSLTTPNPGEVELDGVEIARLALELATRTLNEAGGADVVGITNQRATTIVFDPVTGAPVGPAIGWQDLRTVIDCLVLQGEGLRLAPNQSATKARWLVNHSRRASSELRFATIDTWLAWNLSGGALHVTDRSNAGVNVSWRWVSKSGTNTPSPCSDSTR